MKMNTPTVPVGYVNMPSYDDIVTCLELIKHATAPTCPDGAFHENAFELSDSMLKRIYTSRHQQLLYSGKEPK